MFAPPWRLASRRGLGGALTSTRLSVPLLACAIQRVVPSIAIFFWLRTDRRPARDPPVDQVENRERAARPLEHECVVRCEDSDRRLVSEHDIDRIAEVVEDPQNPLADAVDLRHGPDSGADEGARAARSQTLRRRPAFQAL